MVETNKLCNNKTKPILRNNTSLKTLKMTYHSLFSSHLLYGSQLWGHTNLTNQNKIQKLQNRALRKILFKKQQDSISQYYKELQILKFPDLLYLQNCFFMSQIETTQKLANSFAHLNNAVTATTTKLNLKHNDFLIYLFSKLRFHYIYISHLYVN